MRTLFMFLLLAAAAIPMAHAQPPMPEKPEVDPEIQKLITDAQNSDGKIAFEAKLQLLELGAAVPALTRGLWSDSYTTRGGCAKFLGMIGADARAAVPSLTRILKDDNNTDVRIEAARALAFIGAHSAIPTLTKSLKDEAVAVRLAAAESLIMLGADAETILPSLTKSLKAARPEDRATAIRLIGELGPEGAAAVPALQEAFADADPYFTYRIAETLGRIGPEAKDALSVLKSKVKNDKDAALFRVPVAIALWRISRDRDAIELLRASLADAKNLPLLPYNPLLRIEPSKETVDAIATALKEKSAILAVDVLGPRAKDRVPQIVEQLGDLRQNHNRSQVVASLGRLGPDAKPALEQLRFLAKSKTPELSLAAAIAVYQIEPKPENATAITKFLEEKDERVAAANALKQLKPTGKAVVIELIAALDSTDDEFRLAAASALWRIEKDPAALKAAAKSLRSANSRIRDQAAVSLGYDFGPDAKGAVPDLVKRLFDSHASVRSATAEALGRVGPVARDAVPALLTLLDSDEPAFVQSAACEALGLIKPADKTDAIAVLKAKLDHSAPLVRAHAALALARLGDKTGEDEAVRGLTHRTHFVRITSAETLWRISKDRRTIPLLIRTLEESNLTGTDSENERYMAARALGRIGADAKPAVPELIKLINSRDPDVADTARAALKLIDPDAAKNAGVK